MLIVLFIGLSFLGVWLMVFGVALANAIRDEIEKPTLLKISKCPSPTVAKPLRASRSAWQKNERLRRIARLS